MRSSVELARGAGFCSGVRRALALVERLASLPRQGRLVTLGPLLHNRREVERLRGLGVLAVSEVEVCRGDEVVLRTHGVPPAQLRALQGQAGAIHDATCPYVRSLQVLARRMAAAGYAIVLLGDRDHPEVQSVLAWAAESTPAPTGVVMAVRSAEELAETPPLSSRRVAILAQTTQSPERLRALVDCCLEQQPVELRLFDTICRCTRERRTEAGSLARVVDLMLVVGDQHSANTRELLDVCREVQPRSELVQDASEIDPAWLCGVQRVGVTGGASTSEATLQEVAARLREIEHD